ncbi:MAG: ankyrin repeat domain-containing protein [Sphaerochaetaceae bacterium]|nr:ankyrin repeat domain-containing protein [Spirochaetales bacterium]MDY5499045.1 ankyrin repeat domain-containing protein [Sphaerochaetaceae bacterium]
MQDNTVRKEEREKILQFPKRHAFPLREKIAFGVLCALGGFATSLIVLGTRKQPAPAQIERQPLPTTQPSVIAPQPTPSSPSTARDLNAELVEALQQGDSKAVEAVIREGAYPHLLFHGKSLMEWAVSNDQAELVALLAEEGLDPEAFDPETGTTLLHRAMATHASTDTVKALLDAGANVHVLDHENRNALHWAAEKGESEDVLALLVEKGINPQDEDSFGWNASKYAQHAGYQQLVDKLEELGAPSHATIAKREADLLRQSAASRIEVLNQNDAAELDDLLQEIDRLYASYLLRLPAFARRLYTARSIMNRSAWTLRMEAMRIASMAKGLFAPSRSQESYDREEKETVAEEIQAAFEHEVFTPDQLRNALQERLTDFSYQVNQNRTDFHHAIAGLYAASPNLESIDIATLNHEFDSSFPLVEDEENLAGKTREDGLILIGSTALGATSGCFIGVLPGPLDNLIFGGIGALTGTTIDLLRSQDRQNQLVQTYTQTLIGQRDTIKARIREACEESFSTWRKDELELLDANTKEDFGWLDTYQGFPI